MDYVTFHIKNRPKQREYDFRKHDVIEGEVLSVNDEPLLEPNKADS